MDKLGIKATIYDVLGYVSPGMIFLFSIWHISTRQTQWPWEIEVSAPSAIMAILISYFIGQISAAIGSLIFENQYSNLLFDKLYPMSTQSFEHGSQSIFSKPFASLSERVTSCYCQSKFPEIYDTALVFLSISGFSRNMFVILQSIAVIYIWKNGNDWRLNVFQLIIGLILIHNYRRFKIYYKKQIATSLLMPQMK